MKPAEDAVVLDTTELGIEEAFQAARALVRARLG
jgi:cytidylate kinase